MLFKRYHESDSKIKNFFYRTFGLPHVGTRIRGNAVFRLLKGKKLKILDVGSGYGVFSLELQKRGHEVIAMDLLKGIDFQKIKIVEKIFEKDNQKLTFVNADATKLSFKKNTFDAAIMIDVIEHVPDEDAVLKEMHRVLKPGGFFIASTPTEGFHKGRFKGFFRWLSKLPVFKNLIQWSDYLDPNKMMKIKGHQREYSLTRWKNVCEKYSFILEDWRPEYKFFGAFLVELPHSMKIFEKSNIFFFLYPLVKLDNLIKTRHTGMAVRARKQ